jgi:hypothetical protein
MCKGKEKITTLMTIVGLILVGTTGLLARPCPPQPGKMRQEQCCITFTGEASRGTLIMSENLGRNVPYVAIETKAGEPAEKAIERLANVIEQTNPFDWMITPISVRKLREKIVTSSGGDLQGLVGSCAQYMTAGTETGLGIPQPPHSLTANYDPDLKKIELKWINPPNGFDSIRVRINWSNCYHTGGRTISGTLESYVLDLNEYPVDMGDLDILVIGVRNDIPSNAAAIHVNNNIQEELYGIPFTSGLAPNWQSWSLDTNEGKIGLEMGIRNELTTAKGRRYNPITTAETKPFYQLINIGAKGGTGDVYRKFIGLTPGHTYRVKARAATLSEPNDKNWSVSVHATPNGSYERNLSPRQMAGLDALPCGEKGNAAGRMILYDSSLTTKGKFAEISTDKAQSMRSRETTDITLPQGVDSITVWVRCVSSAGLSTAIDWISLEDLSAPKP